ncbi:MAG TPA: acyltransferase family protein [Phenylobacterium sp.]|uniref:acyltransferase family protein n=1 Tax=Phenylobacterium sp. TaxID=1871053 RepID=UPI002D2EA4A4|nr:acyltransferase family protein [Phenylobacterium sp.]HZZ69297.1 acyltransferase family protein [Phenylobacterium sp.]
MTTDSLAPRAHRRDIDGLRAVAVLAIVAYHAFPAWIPGGFVGVDVFFVISGFLITGIIARGRDEGRFCYLRFYLRRARRIVPAYLVVLAAIAAFMLWLDLPQVLTWNGATLGVSALFAPNLGFLRGSGYFTPGLQQNPMLHLWSLGVEEQFYLVWPLLLALLSLAALRRFRVLAAAVLLVLSLAAAQWFVSHNGAVWSFFLFPTRAWEFLVGGLLALGATAGPRGPVTANAAGGLGLALIAGSVALLNDAAPFPGLSAVPACLGAGLVLWSGTGREPAATGVLRTAPAVGIGLISYSLYLWHWPALTFTREYAQRDLKPLEVAALLALSAGLAVATWRFVEQPWRRRPVARPGRALALTLSPLLIFMALGAGIFVMHGLPMRFSPSALQAANIEFTDINPRRDECFIALRPVPSTGCRFGAAPDAKDYDVLVWGDSHADAATPGAVDWARARGWSVREAAIAGCAALVDARVVAQKTGEMKGCRASTGIVLREIAANPKLKLIVLSLRWPLYDGDWPRYEGNSGQLTMLDARAPGERVYPLDEAIARTLDTIAATGTKARVVILGPVPELTFSPPYCVAMARHLGRSETSCWDAPARLPLIRARAAEARIAAALATHPEVGVFYPARRLCTDTSCLAELNRRLIYFDNDHLSASGSRMLVPGWIDAALSSRGLPAAPPSAGPPPPRR